MIKKQLLILFFFLGYGISAQGMHLQQLLGQGISDFGILKNPTQDDKESYQAYLKGSIPIVLVADRYDREAHVNRLLAEMNALKSKLLSDINNLPADASKTSIDIVMARYHDFFDCIRQMGVVYSARGSMVVRDVCPFAGIMRDLTCLVFKAGIETQGPALQKTKEEGNRHWDSFVEANTARYKFKSDLETLTEEDSKKTAALMRAAQEISYRESDNARKDRVLIECAYTLSNLEDANKDLKADSARQKGVALEVAKEVIALKERNEELQRERDRSSQEKADLTKHFEKEIEAVGAFAIQQRERALSAIHAFHEKIMPLQKELLPLHQELAAKDAEIAELKQALIDRQLRKVARSAKSKSQRRLNALQKAQQK